MIFDAMRKKDQQARDLRFWVELRGFDSLWEPLVSRAWRAAFCWSLAAADVRAWRYGLPAGDRQARGDLR
jgi:hypothetical protein